MLTESARATLHKLAATAVPGSFQTLGPAAVYLCVRDSPGYLDQQVLYVAEGVPMNHGPLRPLVATRDDVAQLLEELLRNALSQLSLAEP